MKKWRLATLTCLVLAIPFACDPERRAEFPDEAEELVPASGTIVPAEAVASKAPAAASGETQERKLADVQRAKTRKKSAARVGAATDNPYGGEGAEVDGGEPAYEAGAAATRGADAGLPDRADGAASAKPTTDGAITPQPQQDATPGAGEASAGDDGEGTDDGSWF